MITLKPNSLSYFSLVLRSNRFSQFFVVLFVMSLACGSVSFSEGTSIESSSVPVHEFLKFFDMNSLVQFRATSKAMKEKVDQNSGFNSLLEFYRFFETQLKEVNENNLKNGADQALIALFSSETWFQDKWVGQFEPAGPQYAPLSKFENLESMILSYRKSLEKELQASTENVTLEKKIKKALQRVNIALGQIRVLKTQLVHHFLPFKTPAWYSTRTMLYEFNFIGNEGILALATESVEAQIQLLDRGFRLESIASIANSKMVADKILSLLPRDSTTRLFIISRLLRQFRSDKEYQAILWDRFINDPDAANRTIYKFSPIISNILSSQDNVSASTNSDKISAQNKIDSHMKLFKTNLVNELKTQENEYLSNIDTIDSILTGISNAQFNDPELRTIAIQSAVLRLNRPFGSPLQNLLKLVKNSNHDLFSPERWMKTIQGLSNPKHQLMAGLSINAPFAKASHYRDLITEGVLETLGQQSNSWLGDIIIEAIPYFSEDPKMLETFFNTTLQFPVHPFKEDPRTQVFVKLIQNESKTFKWVDLILDHLAENMDGYISPLSVEIILSTAAARPFLSLETRARILSLLPAMGLKHETRTLNALAKANERLEQARTRLFSTAQDLQALSFHAAEAAISAKTAHLVAEARRVKIRTLLNITLEAEGFSESLQE